jgi:hypothetical protein
VERYLRAGNESPRTIHSSADHVFAQRLGAAEQGAVLRQADLTAAESAGRMGAQTGWWSSVQSFLYSEWDDNDLTYFVAHQCRSSFGRSTSCADREAATLTSGKHGRHRCADAHGSLTPTDR